jgi:hypothetical protein
MKTLSYPSQNETDKRNQLHTEIGCMGKFTRQELKGSSEVKNGHIPLRQGDWFQFEGESHHTREYLTKFYCCRTVDRSKMPNPQDWQLDLYVDRVFPLNKQFIFAAGMAMELAGLSVDRSAKIASNSRSDTPPYLMKT